MSVHPHQISPTLQDIEILAKQLDVQFSIAAGEPAFDLDADGVWKIGSTYENSPAGIEIAYDDLVRYQLTLQQVGQV